MLVVQHVSLLSLAAGSTGVLSDANLSSAYGCLFRVTNTKKVAKWHNC